MRKFAFPMIIFIPVYRMKYMNQICRYSFIRTRSGVMVNLGLVSLLMIIDFVMFCHPDSISILVVKYGVLC